MKHKHFKPFISFFNKKYFRYRFGDAVVTTPPRQVSLIRIEVLGVPEKKLLVMETFLEVNMKNKKQTCQKPESG